MTEGVWLTRGFDEFRRGSFGNGGQNLYVSRGGVLQRIHQFDLNGNGYLDLVFCNSQAHWERPPAYLYADVFGRADRCELPAEGAMAGVVADLNGDGHDDLVLGCLDNGVTQLGVNAIVYYGSLQGWSERYQQQLPAPKCTAAAAGDFDGDGRPDLAFLCDGRLRVYYQNELGFEPKRFVDLEIAGESLAAGDLDGDGFADLAVRAPDGCLTVYWGGSDGLQAERSSGVPVQAAPCTPAGGGAPPEGVSAAEYVGDAHPLVAIIQLDGAHLFAPSTDTFELVPVRGNREFGEPLVVACHHPMSAAVGDLTGTGRTDLVVAARAPAPEGEWSYVYWGGDAGFSEDRRAALATRRACHVAVGDLDGDGRDEIVFCQNRTRESFTSESLAYRCSGAEQFAPPVRLLSHDARSALIARPAAGGGRVVALVNHYGGTAQDDVPATIYFGGPDGYAVERRRHIPSSGAVEAISCDLDDDGHVDLITCNASEYSNVAEDPGSYVFFNGPEGFAQDPGIVLPTVHAHGACCADLNRDGYLDLVFGGFGVPDLRVFYGSSSGFDPDPVRIRMELDGTVYGEPRWIYLADLNNDGWLDLVVPQITADRSFILWGGPDGFSMDNCQVLSVFHASCVRAADLTDNGYLDLLIGGHLQSLDSPRDSFVYIYWNGPEGLREDRRMLLPSEAVNSMCLADFDGDGLLDLFVCSYGSNRERDLDSYLYWNREGRSFSAADRSRFFTHSASGCFAADFDNDGRTDLAIANHKVWGDHRGESWVMWNGPEGLSTDRVTRLPTAGPHGMNSIGVGSIADRGPEEYYTSPSFELPPATSARQIGWKAQVPPGTWVQAQVRFGPSAGELESSSWLGGDGEDSWLANSDIIPRHPAGGWMQYRLALGAYNSLSTPRVTEVWVRYGGD